jgi:hypothetical protein
MFEFTKYSRLESQISERLRLTIDQVDLETTWQQSQHHSHPIARYNGYLNGACLNALFNWLSDWPEPQNPQPLVWHGQDLASIWEVVNGTAIQIGGSRLVFIPSDESDLAEICVPQEWVDIPSWAGDYYVAVQVNLDGDDDDRCWLEVCGFATHQQLKHQGRYSAGDRTYSLAIDELTASLTVMQITLGLNLQAEVAPVLNLSEMDAAKLLQVLGDSSLYSPRLKVSFEQWAAFLANDKYRQQLYNLRLGIIQEPAVAVATSVVVETPARLVEWVKTYFQAGWQTMDDIIEKCGILESGLIYAIEGGGYRYGGSSNQKGIPTLIELLRDRRNKGNQLRAADLLGCVEPGNQEAIAALTDFRQTTENDTLQRQAAVSLGKLDPNNSAAGVRIGKIMELTIQLDTVRVVLEITLLLQGTDKTNIELRVLPVPSKTSKTLPPNLELIILDEDGEVFWKQKAQNSKKNIPNYEFTAAVGDYFQVKVACDGFSITENFNI